jgi:RNA polymerase sigma-70 factor (ECF subfamily)
MIAMNESSFDRIAYEHALVRRFSAGDETAFVEIVDRYREKLTTLAFSMLKNHADAEEVAQDTFIRAHRGIARFRGDSSLGTWLHRIALNLARNRYWYFCRRGRNATNSLDVVDPERVTLVNLMATKEACPAQEAVSREFQRLVAECIAKLGEMDREILALRYTHDHSYEDISAQLSLNEGTVKSRLARARKRLRELLSANCPDIDADASLSRWLNMFRTAPGVIEA